MSDLQMLKIKVHNVALEARALSRVVDSEAFQKAWEAATEGQRAELWSYVVGIDKPQVDRWVKRVLATVGLEGKSFRELRDIARAAGVMYYNNLSKDELLNELKP